MTPHHRIRRFQAAAAVLIPAAAALVSAPAAPATAATGARVPGWRIVRTLTAAGSSLFDVAPLRNGRAWATGGAGSPASSPLFLHRDGTRWIKIGRPRVTSGSEFAADVSASTNSNVWGAIANGSAVDHWNGHAWHRASFSATLGVGVDGVLAFGTNRARVFTFDFTTKQGAVHYFNGSGWTSRQLPAPVDGDGSVNLVSATSDSNIWAWALDLGLGRWETLHFDGKKWSVVTIPAAAIPANGGPAQLLALSPKNVWGTITANNTQGPIVLLHWNGTAWHKAAGHPPAGELLGPIAPDGKGGLWLYAARPLSTQPFVRPFFLHFRNGTWTRVPAPTSPLGLVWISALGLIPGTTSLWGVGTIQKPMTNVAGVIVKFGR